MKNTKPNLYAVVMAGGKGERFWPMGRSRRPKQLLPLLSAKTMIEETVQRLFPLFQPENILVITNSAYAEEIQSLLPLPPENIIGEPAARGTAPCITLASALICRRDKNAIMTILPADHAISPAKLFQQTLQEAFGYAQKGYMVTLGAIPTYPATGYGYIHLGASAGKGFHHVLDFREKPDLQTAQTFCGNGQYRWNTGIFIWKLEVIMEAFRQCTPALYAKMQGWIAGKDFNTNFGECEKNSIDYAVMEKSGNIVSGDIAFEWSDLGSWSALRSILPADSRGNVLRGKVYTIDSRNNVLLTDENCLMGVIGMENIAAVKHGNAILICPLAREQEVKALVQRISAKEQEYI